MPLNRFIHFTDWVIGHSHLAMIGFASFTALGGLLHAWRLTPGCRYNRAAAGWSFWLLSLGLAAMVLDLTAAGLVQGQLWQGDLPWMDSVRASAPFWWVRSVSGVVVLAGFLAVVASMTTGPLVVPAPGREADAGSGQQDDAEEEVAGFRWLKNAYVLVAGAGVGLFAFSFVVLGLWPNRDLRDQIARTRPTDSGAMSASEARGRLVYAREGCLNCHSQLVRFTEEDVRRFGPASQAWESDGDAPQMWGTRRIGPDLARESGRRPRDWQLAHLWNPRHVVPDSVMPGYPWLFDGSPTRPRSEALDLVNYLESLGRDARLAGLSGPGPLPGRDPEEERRKGMFCDCSIPRTAGKAPIWDMALAVGEGDRFARRGAEVFARNCAGCHGPEGRGDGPAAVALTPAPRNLTIARFSDRRLSESLWNGVRGSSMPPWNDLTAGDLRGLIAFLGTIAPSDPTPEFEAEERATARGLFAKAVRRLPRPGWAWGRAIGGDPGPEPDGLPRSPAHDGLRRVGPGPRGPGLGDAPLGRQAHPGRAEAPGPLRPVLLRQGVRFVTINVIVAAVTVLVGGFVVVWLAFPRCRPWIEAPKWQPLAWDQPPRSDPAGDRPVA